MGKIRRTIGGLLLTVFVVVLFWAPVEGAEYFKQVYGRFSAVAGETLAVGDVVCIKATDSQAYKADADDSDLRPAVGIVHKGGDTDETVEIVFMGVLAGQTAASPGYRVFLANTAGAIAWEAAPTNAQALGWVLPGTTDDDESTDYMININMEPSGGAAY